MGAVHQPEISNAHLDECDIGDHMFIKQPSKSAMLHYIQNLKYEYVTFKIIDFQLPHGKFNSLHMSAPSKTLTSQAWRSLSCDVAMTKRLESHGENSLKLVFLLMFFSAIILPSLLLLCFVELLMDHES